MDEKGKNTNLSKTLEDSGKAPSSWQLTEYDKAFLRSCNIRPQ